MAQKNRSKEIWLVPKRVSLHQAICLIDGIIDRKYDGTSWNSQKQNNLGVNLKNWGATKDGKNVSAQAIRTLVASIPQYLGFLYINTQTTPNRICLTDAGKLLWKNHKDSLVKIKNLKDGKELLIKESKSVLKQMEKLQITNPIIKKDCENISIFPFRFMLKVLLHVEYLDIEEIAYFLFKIRNDDELELIIEEINSFRALTQVDRKNRIDKFRKTHIGNITLVKAPSARYFISLCELTGIVEKIKVKPQNGDKELIGLRINTMYLEYIDEMLRMIYPKAETYDFDDDLQLWIDYIGNPSRNYPPIDVGFINKSSNPFLVQISSNEMCKYVDLINEKEEIRFPLFVDEAYNVSIIDVTNGELIKHFEIVPSFDQNVYEIIVDSTESVSEKENFEVLAENIINHCQSRTFTKAVVNRLNILAKFTGIDKVKDKSLRGAYLEYYFYELLCNLKDEKIIDDVVWNGSVGKYGLPTQAPGGKVGTPDIVFTIDDLDIVLELTTIKPKSEQFKAEGSSVPDHIRLHKASTGRNVAGVFCAPIMHERNVGVMRAAILDCGIKLHCFTEKELIDVLATKNREYIKSVFC